MLPHTYRDVFSYIIWRGHFWHPIWFGTFWISPTLWGFSPISPKSPFSPKSPVSNGLGRFRHYRQPYGDFSKISIFAQIASLQGAGTFFAIIASPLAIFAKIASLQGATFGIQLKLSEAGDFSPFLPFSPLHAILNVSGNGGAFWWFVYIIVCFNI